MTKRSAPPRNNTSTTSTRNNASKGNNASKNNSQRHQDARATAQEHADTDGYTSSKPKSTRPTAHRNDRNTTHTKRYTSNNTATSSHDGQQPNDTPRDRIENQMRQALDLWCEWLDEPKWYQLDRWLKNTLGKNKKYGKRDRLIYGDILFNAARFGVFAATVVEHHHLAPVDAVEETSARSQTAQQLKDWLGGIAHGPLGADFLALCQWRAQPEQSLHSSLHTYLQAINNLRDFSQRKPQGKLIWHGIPTAYLEHLQSLNQSIQPNATLTTSPMDAFLDAQDSRPPLWLRLNHASQKHAAIAELAEHYRITEDGNALAVTGERGIFGLECYQNGIVEIQDWASQQLALKVAATPGQKVWDTCAGGGGKTLAIAGPLNNKGAVWATDIREHKLVEVKRRAKLANFYNIRTAPWNGESPLLLPKEIANDGGFDWVLVDGPCSSSGTWRRNPDAKLRNLGEDLEHLNQLQLQLLTNASQCVKPGGKLVYGTCSFFIQENTHIVEQFLANNPYWKLVEAELIGCPNNNSDTLFPAVFTKPE